MKVLVIGGGGREHAIAWRLSRSPRVEALYVTPGNPGIAGCATCVDGAGGWLKTAEALGVDLTVVGPEAPLVAGVVDEFRAAGRKIIGPTKAAARLEGSKAFSKAFLQRAKIPTAAAVTVDDPEAAKRHLGDFGYPVVLKADGLAAGKGVIIAESQAEALDALTKLPKGRLVIEEFLTGEEVSFIVLADGERAWALEATQDHKTLLDGDRGPNTGGMGAYCDGRIISPAQAASILETVIQPTLAGMIEEGTPYSGFLYAGLMMTAAGPKVLEYNCRLGDPETQALMHRMDSDLLDTLVDGAEVRWRPDPSVCVVMAAHGYPGQVRTGDRIEGLGDCEGVVFHAGTRAGSRGGVETAGGRVLGVTASGADLPSAIENVYRDVARVRFDGMQFRSDIGKKGLSRW